MNLPVNRIICGDAETELKKLPDGSINCCISSPPYWALRDYGIAGQLGLEPTFEEYIDKLCTVYDEVKRVLRPDGTCWVNIADTYGGSTGQPNAPKLNLLQVDEYKSASRVKKYLAAKSLVGIPEMFVLEMQRRGWIRRNTIIWHKPNPMPSSAKDRFTVDFEYVYFFVKNKRYWFEPQYEPYSPNSDMEYRKTLRLGKFYRAGNKNPYKDNTPLAGDRKMTPMAAGRNKRCVWTIPTQPFPEAHFATFPEKLVEPMIKAGCPEFVCKKCGKARERIFDVSYEIDGGKGNEKYDTDNQSGGLESGACAPQSMKYGRANKITTPKGHTDCNCKAGWRSGVTLDMFRRVRNCWRGGREVKKGLYPNRLAA